MHPGDVVADRFEIVRLAGKGGMGRVYEARDRLTGHAVALKVLHDSTQNLERFGRESRLLAALSHPGVVRHVDHGATEEGEPYLVMEWLEGETLSARLRRDRLDVAQSLTLARQVASALGAVHRAGIVHRDIKPSNVFLPRGLIAEAQLIDFGVARGGSDTPLTATGAMVGTPAFVALEQARGERDVDARADVYSLGCVLFRCLTGRNPFIGDDPFSVLLKVATDETPRASTLRPDIPPELDDLVARWMSKARELRPRDGDMAAAELARIDLTSEGGPASVRMASTGPASRRNGQRTVAVVPLRNGGPKADEYLADAFTEDLIDQLSVSEGLEVRPLETVLIYKGTARETRDIGAELAVDMVVSGSVRRVGDVLRVSLRMAAVNGSTPVWAQRFDRPVNDALTAADEIAAVVVEALTPKTGVRAILDSTTRELYLLGRKEYHRFEDIAAEAQLPALRASANRAVELFGQAQARVPDDPSVLAGLALAAGRMWFFDAEGASPRARDAAALVASVAPGSGEALVARAVSNLLDGHLGLAVESASRAVSRAPGLADAHHLLGRLLCEVGPGARGLVHIETAARLDPGFASARLGRLHVYELIGQPAEADRLAAEVLGQKESSVGWASLARVTLWRGDAARAQELLDHPVMKEGKAPSAREILRLLVQPDTPPSPVKMLTTSMGSIASSASARWFVCQVRAEFAAARGKLEDAFTALGEAAEGGLHDRVWIEGCPALREMRADRRFAPLRARVEAHAAVVETALRRVETL